MRAAIRYCRACGCTETDACPGRCSWIAADRCSACVDEPLTLPINAAHLSASRMVEVARINWTAGGSDNVRVMHQSSDFPNLVAMSTVRDGKICDEVLYVGAMEAPIDDLAFVADLLNHRRKAA